MRPIDADALVEAIKYYPYGFRGMIVCDIAKQPTIDAVPVVRCKDCKHYREGEVLSPQKFCFRLIGKGGEAIGYNFAEDDFCCYGEL